MSDEFDWKRALYQHAIDRIAEAPTLDIAATIAREVRQTVDNVQSAMDRFHAKLNELKQRDA